MQTRQSDPPHLHGYEKDKNNWNRTPRGQPCVLLPVRYTSRKNRPRLLPLVLYFFFILILTVQLPSDRLIPQRKHYFCVL